MGSVRAIAGVIKVGMGRVDTSVKSGNQGKKLATRRRRGVQDVGCTRMNFPMKICKMESRIAQRNPKCRGGKGSGREGEVQ
jgi:hypothetical protein